MQDAPSFRVVHDSLLERYASALEHVSSAVDRLSCFRRASTSYLLDAVAFRAFFESETSHVGAAAAAAAGGSGEDDKPSAELLQEIYVAWRRRDIVEASLARAGWMLSQGGGREASDLIQRARVEVDGPKRERLEDAWRRIVDESTKRRSEKEATSDDDDDAMDQD